TGVQTCALPISSLGLQPDKRSYPVGRPGNQISGRSGRGSGNDPDLGGHGALCGCGAPPSSGDVAGDPTQGGHLVEGCLYAVFPGLFKNGFPKGNGKTPT